MAYLLSAFVILIVSYAYAFPQDLDLENLFKTVALVLVIILIFNLPHIIALILY